MTAVLAGCGGGAATSFGPAPIPVGIGRGVAYRPPSLTAKVEAAQPVGRLRCSRSDAARHGVYLELFANRHVVLIPPGIGIAPPRREAGAYVDGGRCSYPLRTREPTGVIEVAAGTQAVLGDFFALWSQPLSNARMAGFGGPIRVYLDGRRVAGDPRAVPLRRHAAIVVEVGSYLPPHRSYGFPPGL